MSMPKIHTYEFTYDEKLDGFGSVRFCARSKAEARTLFREFQEENHFTVAERDFKIERVYDQSDAECYGPEYYS